MRACLHRRDLSSFVVAPNSFSSCALLIQTTEGGGFLQWSLPILLSSFSHQRANLRLICCRVCSWHDHGNNGMNNQPASSQNCDDPGDTAKPVNLAVPKHDLRSLVCPAFRVSENCDGRLATVYCSLSTLDESALVLVGYGMLLPLKLVGNGLESHVGCGGRIGPQTHKKVGVIMNTSSLHLYSL